MERRRSLATARASDGIRSAGRDGVWIGVRCGWDNFFMSRLDYVMEANG